VLQVNKLYPPVVGGVEKVTRQLAEGLADRTDMKVLVCRRRGRTRREFVKGVDLCQAGSLGLALSMPLSLSFFVLFRRLIRDRDILHIHMPFPLADLALLLFRFRGKVVLWWHSDILRQKRLLALYRPLMKRTLDRADVIITATQGHIDGSAFLPAYREKCVIIPFGAEAALLADGERAWRARPPEPAEGNPSARQAEPAAGSKAPEPDAAVTFLFVGRLVYYKGCDILLEAFRQVRGAQLVIIGSGPLEDQLKEQARQWEIRESVTFKGYLEDEEIQRYWVDCDVFVLPSVAKTEAFGLVQLEAMAYGKPVINTRLPGGVPSVSLDGITGLTVPPGDAAALAEAMQRLTDDPALRRRLGEGAYRRVREGYRMDQMLDQVYAVYRRLAPG
jgi:rhamnosyl/mannosyltransferase